MWKSPVHPTPVGRPGPSGAVPDDDRCSPVAALSRRVGPRRLLRSRHSSFFGKQIVQAGIGRKREARERERERERETEWWTGEGKKCVPVGIRLPSDVTETSLAPAAWNLSEKVAAVQLAKC